MQVNEDNAVLNAKLLSAAHRNKVLLNFITENSQLLDALQIEQQALVEPKCFRIIAEALIIWRLRCLHFQSNKQIST